MAMLKPLENIRQRKQTSQIQIFSYLCILYIDQCQTHACHSHLIELLTSVTGT